MKDETVSGNMQITAFTNLSADEYKDTFKNAIGFIKNEVLKQGFIIYMEEQEFICEDILQYSIKFLDIEKI